MGAWIELFRSNPVACTVLTFVVLAGTAAIIAAIRGEGRK
jgi:hypothetical protein